jgi:hypothetical protein
MAGGDPSATNDYNAIYNPLGTLKPSGDGFITHNFGIYTNILDVAGFGFGLGYSTWLKTYEGNLRKNGIFIPKTGPMFNGFDLRIQYTGINKLVITSFNNVSFGSTAISSVNNDVIGVTGVHLPNNTSQDWFALFNSVTVVYNITSRLIVSAQAASRYGLINTEVHTPGRSFTMERGRRQIGGGAYAAYKFSWFDLQIGASFRHFMDSYSNTGSPAPGAAFQTVAGYRDASGGSFDFAVPVQITFVF